MYKKVFASKERAKYNIEKGIHFSPIWDNGAQIGIDGGRTLYFNGLARAAENGTLKLQVKNWQWHQTFGLDTSNGQNGQILKVAGAKTVQIDMQDHSKGEFRKLELQTNKGAVELWINHPDKNIIAFTAEGNLYSANLPKGIKEIYKVQFVGLLDLLDVEISSISFQP